MTTSRGFLVVLIAVFVSSVILFSPSPASAQSSSTGVKLFIGFDDANLARRLANSDQRRILRGLLVSYGASFFETGGATETLGRFKAALTSLISCGKITSLSSCGVQRDYWLIDSRSLSGTNATATSFLVRRMLADGLIKYAEPPRSLSYNRAPNDPTFSSAYHLNNTGQVPRSIPNIDINAPEAWDVGVGTGATVIATLDSGVDGANSDLTNNLYINSAELNGKEGVDDDNDGYIDNINGCDFGYMVRYNSNVCYLPVDFSSHGTNVAGIIAAEGNNSTGRVGALWKTRLMALNVDKFDLSGDIDGAAIIRAITYAVELKQRGVNIRVINISLGRKIQSRPEFDAFRKLEEYGILLVAAAGNSGSNNDINPVYPANYPFSNIISVASVSPNGELAPTSNYGVNTVDLAAPGESILTYGLDGYYDSVSGTSFAAPMVSAAAALAWDIDPSLTVAQVKSIILNSSKTAAQLPALAGLNQKLVSPGILNMEGVAYLARYHKNPSWQNPVNRLDVNGDGTIVAGDVLDVINYINSGKPSAIPDYGKASPPNGKFLDINGDGFIAANDAIEIINYINSRPY